LPLFDIFGFLRGVFLGQVGEETWLFLPAVVVRVIILYIYAFTLLRLMGKRENKQLTMFDAVVIVILGDLIGTPTIDFEMPLLFAMLALGVFILFERGFIILIQHSRRLEDLIESKPSLLVEDSKVNVEALHKEKLGVEELYSSLRLQNISNLGQVEKAYLESSGAISVFKKEKPSKGLSIFPPGKGAPPHYGSNDYVEKTEEYSCWRCGNTQTFSEGEKFTLCQRCKGKEWVSPEIN
jgi:uncharacterized membrane protein YcaP (DUF421 family)